MRGAALSSFFSIIQHSCFGDFGSKSTSSYTDHAAFHSIEDIRNTAHRRMAKGRRLLSLQTVDLKVRMCCTGCERVVKQALLKLRGIDSVEVDLGMEKVTVRGYVERSKVLKEVRRSGKKAEFWPNPDQPCYFTTAKNYFYDEEAFRESYNYYRHGYNDAGNHGYAPVPHRGDDRVSNLFNDDDVNACAIM